VRVRDEKECDSGKESGGHGRPANNKRRLLEWESTWIVVKDLSGLRGVGLRKDTGTASKDERGIDEGPKRRREKL